MAHREDQLLRRAIAGDRGALTELLAQYEPLVRLRLAGKIDPRWRAVLSEDDVLQETYTDVFLGIARFAPQGDGAFLRWVLTLARNNLLDAVKGLRSLAKGGDRQRVGASSDESYYNLLQNLDSEGTTPSMVIARDESAKLLNEAIARLPAPDATVVRLYDLEGRPMDEVAAALGCSHGAVFMRRARAHARLRKLLGASFPL
jgi:RNA polymerase sigma-70 factor (ECF subfamily)